jgi:hypothetical protein
VAHAPANFSALGAGILVLHVTFRDGPLTSLVAATPLLSLPALVTTLFLRCITLSVRAGAFALVFGPIIVLSHFSLLSLEMHEGEARSSELAFNRQLRVKVNP